MESIVHLALEEICSQAANGLSLTLLWPKLLNSLSSAGLYPCDAVKRAFWSNLLKVPGLQFVAEGVNFDPTDSKVGSFEECEKLHLKIIAAEHLRDCFLGLYDCKVPDSRTSPQRPVLERLAISRANGVTQDQLCKELGIRGNNFFYVVKTLECRGLVVRQSTIVRKKEAFNDTASSSSPVHTNLIRLHRYASPLGSLQRLEITKGNINYEENVRQSADSADGNFREYGQEDVLVKDFLPAMKAICDKLEQADGKVLVVSDIKKNLGYQRTQGHRAWRNICGKLKQAGFVEVFDAKVDDKAPSAGSLKKSRSREQNKPVSCLRLVKKFSAKVFEPRTLDTGYDVADSEQLTTSGKGSQNTEQLVELPIDQQIFDMIDAEGSKGIVVFEVCKRLGINNKRNHNRLTMLASRFGLVQLPENHKRGTAFRVWTPRNFGPESTNSSRCKSGNLTDENGSSTPAAENLGEPVTPELDSQTMDRNSTTPRSPEKRDAEQEPSTLSQRDGEAIQMSSCPSNPQGSVTDQNIAVPDVEHCLVNVTESSAVSLETLSSALPKPLNTQPRQRYPSLNNVQREQRILEMLKKEKIILKCELHRWLESLEDKHRKMDRKTLTRCLKKLEQEGHCKFFYCSVPGVTNYGRHRELVVILHPSVETNDLSDQVHNRLRSFEMQTRGQGSSRLKNEQSVPVLNGIQRIQNFSSSDAQGFKSEAMRLNGYILARMVRAKLLHHFLWGYVNESYIGNTVLPLAEDLSQSTNPHSTSKLLDLDAAVKAIPLELFLQVVGSSYRIEDMVEKCKNGVLLSDLAKEEYRLMMDTHATGRLSWLIDILRRLRLIRLVADKGVKEGPKNPHATLTHALELKPYIEEPPLGDDVSIDSGSLDLRPHFRHDFVLSTREAVEKYWQTLEYCYAACDPEVASHAFPGASVHEVFLQRSWTTVRVMTAEQRAELVKRVVKDGPFKKLTFQDCREIAKDLKLNLEQVLRVYYEYRQRRLKQYQGGLDSQDQELHATDNGHPSSRKKRKISSEAGSLENVEVNYVAGHVPWEQQSSFISQCAMPKLKQPCQGKFLWTEETDRQLLIEYARQRAAQGARRGTDWSSITDLPAPPDTCMRRMAFLRRNTNFRKALMRLCNLLTERYSQHLERTHERSSTDDVEYGQESDFQEEQWDSFDDPKIKIAFDEVLMCKQIAKSDAARGTRFPSEGMHRASSAGPVEIENDCGSIDMNSSQRASHCRLPRNFIKHLKRRVGITKQVYKSLAVSNAIELFKLIFLSTSKAPEVPKLLAETLRCYSEQDLFSAFDYLREKKLMVGSNGSKPFVLSQNFLQGLSLSPFPTNTSKRAAKFASWISEREKELMEGEINLASDMQCGDIFHLFALVSSEELSISPLLPDDGIGEAEDSRSLKRKFDGNESGDVDKIKKQKFHSLQESELFSRREKGFPGIAVSISRSVVSRSDVVKFFGDEDNRPFLLSESDNFYATLGQKISSTVPHVDYMKEAMDFDRLTQISVESGGSLWKAMSNYAKRVFGDSIDELTYVYPEVFRTAYMAIQKAGDQGLSLLEVSAVINMQSTKLAECAVDVLQAFGQVLKVNGYNSIHIVDALYGSKYSLNAKTAHCQDHEIATVNQLKANDDRTVSKDSGNGESGTCLEMGVSKNIDEVHKVTILNLSEEVSEHSNAIQTCRTSESGGHDQYFHASSGGGFPILPWINGDGTLNGIVYKGLTRRILGIVMQNPGILEDNIIRQMEVLNPQSCRKLLELMILDNHLLVRKMHQATSFGAPVLLKALNRSHFRDPEFVCREHLFANPMSTKLL
ncbi:hypothetical protein Ancab_028284 [Ancistrocladus abbreviatus]